VETLYARAALGLDTTQFVREVQPGVAAGESRRMLTSVVPYFVSL
jgi:hypothetical protein